MRRSKGEGSVYQRKDGLWVARYEAAGKRKYIYGKSKKAVTDKLRERLSSGLANLAPEGDGMSVGEYLDRWLPTILDTVKERTWVRHEEIVRLHLKPSIGHVKLQKLNALDVQELYRTKLDSGLSARTVQIIHTTLHKALKQAVRWSLVQKNVTEAVTPPRPQKKEIRVLTTEEARRLLMAARGERFEALYVLAITTGMRQGELLGLQWRDVSLEDRTLRVRRTVFNGVVSPPKTAAGNRTIHLSGLAVAALREHRLATAKQRISEWVFSTKAGRPISVHNVHNRSWKPLLKRAGLPASTRMHDLRHTCATLLLARGVPVKVVSEMLGHGDVTITLAVYQSVLPHMQESAARVMDDFLG